MTLDDPVRNVAVSDDASVVVVTAGSRAVLWSGGVVELAGLTSPTQVAVDADGSAVAVLDSETSSMTIFGPDGTVRTVADTGPVSAAALFEDSLVTFSVTGQFGVFDPRDGSVLIDGMHGFPPTARLRHCRPTG